MAMSEAYDRKTGRKLDHLIPEHWFDDPVLGQYVSRTARNQTADPADAPPTPTKAPAAGDNKKE